MLFVTFHGGSSSGSINNIYAYATTQTPPTAPASTGVLGPSSDDLSELRTMVFANNYLYVANGSNKTSNVQCFDGSGTSYTLKSTFISHNVNSVNHPFDVAFDQAGHCFVSNQDTNLVAWFDVTCDGESSTPGPVSSYLKGLKLKGYFLDATFVASKDGTLPNVPATPTLSKGQGGLDVKFSGSGKDLKVQNSVRGLLYLTNTALPAPGLLLVVDEPGNCVRMYNASTGDYLGKSSGALVSPTHLSLDPAGTTIYVSAKNEIWSSPLPTSLTNPKLGFQSVFSTTLGEVAGIAFDQTLPYVYVAIRTGTPQILRMSPTFQDPTTYIGSPPDAPEFLLYVPDSGT